MYLVSLSLSGIYMFSSKKKQFAASNEWYLSKEEKTRLSILYSVLTNTNKPTKYALSTKLHQRRL